MEIRNMRASDKGKIIDMMRVFYASPAVMSNGSEEIFSNDVENCINDCPYLEGYVFEDNGEILGYAMAAKGFSTEFGKPCIWLEDLYIKENFRGHGIAKIFFEYITEKYKEHVFRLEVEEDNTRAVSVYRSAGFDVLPYTEMIKL